MAPLGLRTEAWGMHPGQGRSCVAQEGQLYSANGETESERSPGACGLKRDLLTHG